MSGTPHDEDEEARAIERTETRRVKRMVISVGVLALLVVVVVFLSPLVLGGLVMRHGASEEEHLGELGHGCRGGQCRDGRECFRRGTSITPDEICSQYCGPGLPPCPAPLTSCATQTVLRGGLEGRTESICIAP